MLTSPSIVLGKEMKCRSSTPSLITPNLQHSPATQPSHPNQLSLSAQYIAALGKLRLKKHPCFIFLSLVLPFSISSFFWRHSYKEEERAACSCFYAKSRSVQQSQWQHVEYWQQKTLNVPECQAAVQRTAPALSSKEFEQPCQKRSRLSKLESCSFCKLDQGYDTLWFPFHELPSLEMWETHRHLKSFHEIQWYME